VSPAERIASTPARARPRPLRIGAVIAIGLAAGLVAWFLTGSDGGKSGQPVGITGPAGPLSGTGKTVPVNEQGLQALAGVLRQPIYWAGHKPGFHLELTRGNDGRVFVRYLPPGAKIGEHKPFLTIATYPLDNAYEATRSAAAKAGGVKLAVPNGVAFYNRKTPTSVYLAYRNANVQVEIFDPSASVARKTFASGTVSRVPGKSPPAVLSTAPQGLTLAGLKAFARKVHHPVYWIGPRGGTTYEVTQTLNGQIFVRYLPAGVSVGSKSPYLTLGTYPVQGAFDVVRALASKPGSVRVIVPGSGVAFYARSRPTNLYEAFPGNDYQAEVYDPSVSEGLQLVKAARVVPIH
jgi:hypothetical protein